MYIKNIKIRNYRNFLNNSINFSNKINTIIGENSTGKTNLFYALRHLFDKNLKSKMSENDFSYSIGKYRGHWIFISATLEDVPDIIEAVELDPNPETKGAIYTIIFRPKIIIRNKLNILSTELSELKLFGEEKEYEISEKQREIDDYINTINIAKDYEMIQTVSCIFDFQNEELYRKIVGDFDNYDFPSPDDLQEDRTYIGNVVRNVNDYIDVTFIPAIRDVNRELTRENNFFFNMLKTITKDIDPLKWESINAGFEAINQDLQSIEEYSDFSNKILDTMLDTVGRVYSSDVALDVELPHEKDDIIKYFILKGKMGSDTTNLFNKSLGENNILYFALKLLQNKYTISHSSIILDILLIEEPEAHIHKHIQQTLFAGIENRDNQQIFMSTHSVHVSESSKISSMVILSNDEYKTKVFLPSNKLNDIDKRYLERFLDNTRVPLLFSKNVLLVEGTAEIILIPCLLKVLYNIDLNSYGISIISMDSCFFENISKLFHKDRLQKQCVILTDGDKDFTSDKKYADREKNATDRLNKLKKLHKENSFVNIQYNDVTFEIELFKNNIPVLCDYIKDAKLFVRDENKVILELLGDNDEERYQRILSIAKKNGKGWFALDFSEWLERKRENILFKIPEYILKGVGQFFINNTYSKNIINVIIDDYKKINNITPDDNLLVSGVDDKLISILLEKYYNE